MTQLGFRLFVSSTFVDFQHERAWLHNIVFPQIKQRCEEHGVDFQSVDLRWGVSQEAGLDQNTMEICLNELGHCRDVSENPFLLILAGDRYGWRPLPSRIPSETFEAWCAEMSREDSELFRQWYQVDKNILEASVVLRSRRGVCEEDQTWFELEDQMHAALDKVLTSRSKEDQTQYSFSATHHEIVNGLEGNGKNNCVVIKRNLVSAEALPNYFVDSGDTLIQQRELSASLMGQVEESKCFSLEAHWQQDKFDEQYKEQFCQIILNQFEQAFQRLIEQDIPQKNFIQRQHDAFASSQSEYVARPSVEQEIINLIGSSDGKPAVLVGGGGAGKSSLVTGVATQLESEKIVRYIGLDQESCQSPVLLESILKELASLYGEEITRALPKRESEILTEALNRIPVDRPLTLYIDALDRIAHQPGDIWFGWLPLRLPPHVKVFATVIDGEVAQRLQGLLDDIKFLNLDQLQKDDAQVMLDRWMSARGRKLQPNQAQQVIDTAVSHPAPPLMLKMSSMAAQFWDHDSAPDFVSTSNKQMVADIYELLASKRHHGVELTRAVSGIIALSRGGVTESALLAMLGKHQAVMDEYHVRYPFSPETESLPPIIWSRLRLDMGALLIEHEEDGERVLYFAHQQFVTQTKQLLSDEQETQLRQLMIEHYSDREHFPFWRQSVSNPSRYVLKELPWQLVHARDEQRLTDLLTDFNFLIAKCAAAQLDDLLDTFARMREYIELNDDLLKIERSLVKLAAVISKKQPSHKEFLQQSYELGELHPLKMRAKWWLKEGHCDWLWMASKYPINTLNCTIEIGSRITEITSHYPINESLFATGLKQGIVQIVDARTARIVVELVGHQKPVRRIIAGFGNDLITVASDESVRVWDIDTGREVRLFRPNKSTINVALLGDDRILLQEADRLTIYNYFSGEQLAVREFEAPQKDSESGERPFSSIDTLPMFSFDRDSVNISLAMPTGGVIVTGEEVLLWTLKGLLIVSALDLSTVRLANHQQMLSRVSRSDDGGVTVITVSNGILNYVPDTDSWSEVIEGSGFSGLHRTDEDRYLHWIGAPEEEGKMRVSYRNVDLQGWQVSAEGSVAVPQQDHFFRGATSSVYRRVLMSGENRMVLITQYSAYILDLETSEIKVLFVNDKLWIGHAYMLDEDRIVMTQLEGTVLIYSIGKRRIVGELFSWLGTISTPHIKEINANYLLLQRERGKPLLFDKQLFINEFDGGQLTTVKGQAVKAVTSFGDGYRAEVISPEMQIEHVHVHGPEIPEDMYMKQSGHHLPWEKQDHKKSRLGTHIVPFGSLIIGWGDNGLVTLRSAQFPEPIATWETKELNISKVIVLDETKQKQNNAYIDASPFAVAIQTKDHKAYCWLPYIKESIELTADHPVQNIVYAQNKLSIYGGSEFTIFELDSLTSAYCVKSLYRDYTGVAGKLEKELAQVVALPGKGALTKFISSKPRTSALLVDFADEEKQLQLHRTEGDVRLMPLGDFGIGFVGCSKDNENEFGFFHFNSERFYSYESPAKAQTLQLTDSNVLVLDTPEHYMHFSLEDFNQNQQLKRLADGIYTTTDGVKIRRGAFGLRFTPSEKLVSKNAIDWNHGQKIDYFDLNRNGTLVVHNNTNLSMVLQGFIGNKVIPLNQLGEFELNQSQIKLLSEQAELTSIRTRLQEVIQLIDAATFPSAFEVMKIAEEKMRGLLETLPHELLMLREYCYLQIAFWTQPYNPQLPVKLVELQHRIQHLEQTQGKDLSQVRYVIRLLQPLSNIENLSDKQLIKVLCQIQGSQNSMHPFYETVLADLWMLVVEKLLASYPEQIGAYKIDLFAIVDRLINIGLASEFSSVWQSRTEWLQNSLQARKRLTDPELDNTLKPLPEEFSDMLVQAEAGNADAWLNLGLLWGRGEKIEKDLNQARLCYEKATELGDSNAPLNLNRMYFTGVGVKKDHKKALHYLIISAERGRMDAMTNLGAAYLEGDMGLKKDWHRAVEWLNRGASLGDDLAMVNLAVAYTLKAPDYLRDAGKALEYLDVPLKRGNLAALRLHEVLKKNV